MKVGRSSKLIVLLPFSPQVDGVAVADEAGKGLENLEEVVGLLTEEGGKYGVGKCVLTDDVMFTVTALREVLNREVVRLEVILVLGVLGVDVL